MSLSPFLILAADGKVVSMQGTHDPAATNFSKTKKATWIANVVRCFACGSHLYSQLPAFSSLLKARALLQYE